MTEPAETPPNGSKAAEDPGHLVRLAEPLSHVTPLAAMTLAGLYTVGIIIVNLDLGRHGLFHLDLARPEYVMAGTLWAMLTLATAWGTYVAATRLAWTGVAWTRRPWILFQAAALTLGTASILLGAVGYDAGPSRWWWHLLAMAVVAANGASAWHARGVVRETLRNVDNLGAIFTVFWCLAVLGLYTTAVFPFIPKGFGGGRKAMVEVLLTDPGPHGWASYKVAVSEDGRRIGPVVLLLETASAFVVKAPEVDVAWWHRGPSHLPTVALDRKLVSAIVYVPAGRGSGSPPSPPSPPIAE
jgi:hypothetical protein